MKKKNASPLIISVSGLRGQVGYSLTPDVVQCYIFAFAEFLRIQKRDSGGIQGKILVASDGRESAEWIAESVERGFRAAGVEVLNIGIAATPTLGFMVKHLKAPAGVQITASHNPNPWNGLKLFNEEGRVIPKASGEKVKRFYQTLREEEFMINSNFDEDGAEEQEKEAAEVLPKPQVFQKPHAAAILKQVDAKAIKKCKFTVLLDSNHGSGSVLAPVLMKDLGCKLIFTDKKEAPDGKFIHTPEPTKENLRKICPMVEEVQADVGFCQDPDADRLAILAEDGTYIGEECTVALCAQDLFLAGKKGPIVTNCSTSQMTRDAAEAAGSKFFTSAVGEANVVDKMLETKALFGGEGNGGPIYPKVGLVRDSFLGMALVLDLMARTGKRVSELAAELPQYVIVKSKVDFPRECLKSLYDEIQEKYPDAETDFQDGLRLAWEKNWIHVRPSNTEPVIRIIVEAPTKKEADKISKAVVKLAKAY